MHEVLSEQYQCSMKSNTLYKWSFYGCCYFKQFDEKQHFCPFFCLFLIYLIISQSQINHLTLYYCEHEARSRQRQKIQTETAQGAAQLERIRSCEVSFAQELHAGREKRMGWVCGKSSIAESCGRKWGKSREERRQSDDSLRIAWTTSQCSITKSKGWSGHHCSSFIKPTNSSQNIATSIKQRTSSATNDFIDKLASNNCTFTIKNCDSRWIQSDSQFQDESQWPAAHRRHQQPTFFTKLRP